MSVKWKGTGAKGPIKILDAIRVDADGGRYRDEQWIGESTAIRSLYYAIRDHSPDADAREVSEGNSPLIKLISSTRLANESGVEPTEEWTFTTELLERSLFEVPAAAAEAVTYSQTVGPLSQYRHDIEKAAEDGEGLPSNLASLPTAVEILRLLGMGVTGWEDETVVLRRTRRAQLDYNFAFYVQEPKFIFTTDQLGVPAEFQYRFNELFTGPTPVGTMLGWRLRTQELTQSGDQMEETIEWMAGYWSLLFYVAATESYP